MLPAKCAHFTIQKP